MKSCLFRFYRRKQCGVVGEDRKTQLAFIEHRGVRENINKAVIGDACQDCPGNAKKIAKKIADWHLFKILKSFLSAFLHVIDAALSAVWLIMLKFMVRVTIYRIIDVLRFFMLFRNLHIFSVPSQRVEFWNSVEGCFVS